MSLEKSVIEFFVSIREISCSFAANILVLNRRRFARKPNRENGASAQGGSHFDSSAVRAGDASDRGQPQPRAVGIRAEEGTEDSRQIFFVDATAVVFDFDNHFPARSTITVALTQPHDHSPVSVNSLNSVSEQPMRGGFDLRRVNLHDDQRRIGGEFYLDLPALR